MKRIKSFQGIVIDPGFTVDKTSGGIIIPPQLRAPYKIGRVISQNNKTLKKGDWVIYHMEKATDLNFMTRRPMMLDGKLHIFTDEAFIQGKIVSGLEEIKLHWDKGLGIPELDYEGGQVEAVGSKVYVRIDEPERITKAGIILPEAKIGKDICVGTVIGMGPTANRHWINPDEVKVGDVVRLPKFPSGSTLSLTKNGEKVHMTNGSELVMKWQEDKRLKKGGHWKPVGGYLLIQPYYHGLKTKYEDVIDPVTFKKLTQKVYYNENNPSLTMPVTADLAPLVSTVIAAGDGMKSDAPGYGHMDFGKQKFYPGLRVHHAKLTAGPMSQFKYIGGVHEIEHRDGEQPHLLIPSNMVDGLIKGYKADHFAPSQSQPMLTASDHGIGDINL